ncbi:aa3-type cytochrome oxidase subunit IV [Corynebacterium endometrii]|uniref:Cytochrome c oxidase polypeptide 4 n=1 Tax=Corynebacterium endometrii TaxID=2488819 RepID=A0A4P7QGD6_9CORY|nr:cytochrome c oxidase subunit 4 [Corynebacterium endometrii]QCB28831.1 Cytochrome c oxidase polypeptide 4 [Corynebacterium endometrii]
MRVGAKVFYGIAVYLVISLVVYTIGVNYIQDDGYAYGPEWIGIVGLTLATLLCLMLAGYLHFTDSRTDIAPEDWEEAEVADGAGILGFFSPNSIWPIAMAGSIAVMGLGIIFVYYWLIVLGAALLVFTVTKLSLQYGLPKEKH